MSVTTQFLDSVTGGGFLPYVYCKKVVIENHPDFTDAYKIIVHIEILQEKNKLLQNPFFNPTAQDVLGVRLTDYIYIQFVPFSGVNNVKKLYPGSANDIEKTYVSNVAQPISPWAMDHPDIQGILLNTHLPGASKKLYSPLPHGPVPIKNFASGEAEKIQAPGLNTIFGNDPLLQGFYFDTWPPPPYRLSIDSALGDIFNKTLNLDNFIGVGGIMENAAFQVFGNTRQEIINGKIYYAIPFQIPFNHFFNEHQNLGFLFYTFFNTPLFVDDLKNSYEEVFNYGGSDPFIDYGNLFSLGPVNTEVIFLNGKTTKTRDQFHLDDGEAWNGPAHVHIDSSAFSGEIIGPDPSGYAGNGGYGPNQGWMVGQRHSGPENERLRLLKVPNTKIQNFTFDKNLDLDGFLTVAQVYSQQFFGAGDFMNKSILKNIISPFEKQNKKYLDKLDASSHYDNDSEFSKLYISRDHDNNARGMFFIDFKSLLTNNSLFFSSFNEYGKKTLLKSCLEFSSIQRLTVLRDRVHKKLKGKIYEKFQNDTYLEEPSQVIARGSDNYNFYSSLGIQGGGSLQETNVDFLNSVKPTGVPGIKGTTGHIRNFGFTDKDVSNKSAGHYQYKINLDFIDGSYQYIRNFLNDMLNASKRMELYYEIASTGVLLKSLDGQVVTTEYIQANSPAGPGQLVGSVAYSYLEKPNITAKRVKYYQDGAFTSGFEHAANYQFPDKPWNLDPIDGADLVNLIVHYTKIFENEDNVNETNIQEAANYMRAMVNPTTGSPEGILYILKIAKKMCERLTKVLSKTPVSKKGCELSKVAGGNYNISNFSNIHGKAATIIQEEHVFNDPKEIFTAVNSKNIYIDYLSIGTPTSPGPLPGLASYHYLHYQNRCRLDALKISEAAVDDERFNDQVFVLNVEPPTGDNTLAGTGYSYLSPSIIEMETNKNGYGFMYSAFVPGADIAGTDPLTPNQTDLTERVVLSILDYVYNKEEINDADITTNYFVPNKIGPDPSDIAPAGLEPVKKEFYKNLFGSFGLTLHTQVGYNQTFNKFAGAISEDLTPVEVGSNELVAQYPNDFSDQSYDTSLYFKDIYYDEQNTIRFINSPDVREIPPPKASLPNIIKINSLINDTDPGDNLFQLNQDYINFSDSYAFLNMNLLMRVEYYTGPTAYTAEAGEALPLKGPDDVFVPGDYETYYKPIKDDDESWQLLTRQIYEQNASGLPSSPASATLFCRLVYYDESATKQYKLPVVNRYFLLVGGQYDFSGEGVIQDNNPATSITADIDTMSLNITAQGPEFGL